MTKTPKTPNDSIDKLLVTLSEHSNDFIFDLSYDSISSLWTIRIDRANRKNSESPTLVTLCGHGSTLEAAVDDFCAWVDKAVKLRKDLNPNVSVL